MSDTLGLQQQQQQSLTSHQQSPGEPDDQSNHLKDDPASTATTIIEHAAQLLSTNKQSEFLEIVRELRQCLDERSSECGLLKMKLSESDERAEMLSRELNGCKLTMFQNNEDSKKLHEEVTKSKKLEEDYVKLMSNYLNLEERFEQYRQNLYDTYLAKTNAINNYECIMSREVMKHELELCRVELHQKVGELSLVTAKLRNLEEDNSTKENCISELMKTLEDAKVTHKHEITVLEEYTQCLKNTITSYERTLASYLDIRQQQMERSGQSEVTGDTSPVSLAQTSETEKEPTTISATTTTATALGTNNVAAQADENGDI